MRHLLLIMIISAGFAPVLPAQTDFRINEENIPSTFRQYNPRLYSAPSNGFIVAWEDSRDGDPGYYALQFDNDGFPAIRSNFRIDSHYDLSVTDDNSFFTLRPQSFSYFYPPYYEVNIFSLYGRVYRNYLPAVDPFLMIWQEVPWCGTGVLPRNHTLTYGAGYHLFAMNWGLHLRKYDVLGNLVHIEQERYYERFHIGDVSLAITDRGDYVMTWFSADQWETSPGVYATFFNAQDSVIADSIRILSYEGYDEWYWFSMNDPLVHAVALADTAYQIFIIQRDTVNLRYRRFDIAGNPVGDMSSLDLPVPDIESASDYASIDARFSRGAGGEILLFVTTSRSYYNEISYTTSVITFDRDGTFSHLVSIDEAIPYLHRGAHYIGDNSFFVAGTRNNDIYLYTLTDFTVIDSMKVNDDIYGGNQISPRVTAIDETTFFVSWEDEIRNKGRKVTIDGTLADEEIILDIKEVLFFPDGTMIGPWRKSLSGTSTGVGYTLHALNGDVLLSDTIATTTKTFDHYLRIASAILDDGTCVIAYTTPGDLRMRRIAHDGTVIKEIAVASVHHVYTLNIFKDSDGSFWVNWVTSAQQFNSELEPAGDIVDSKTLWDIYVGNGNVLNYRRDYFDDYYGTFVSVTGDTILADVKLAHNASEFTAWSLPDKRFLVVYQSGGKLYTHAYSHEGIALGDSVMIHQDVGSTKKNPAVSYIGDRLLFSWADIRPPGYGYDIYGRVLKLSDIISSVETVDVAIPESHILFQSYPNPFNPVTYIQYSIPKAGVVSVKVYDILGKEVKTIIDEYHRAGTYRIPFDGSGLSSGVYIYRITAGPFTDAKRMTLVR